MRIVESSTRSDSVIAAEALVTITGNSGYSSCSSCHFSDAMIEVICDVNIAAAIQFYIVRIIQCSRRCIAWFR